MKQAATTIARWLLLMLVATAPAQAAVLTFYPVADNSLYVSPTGSLSNGAGEYLFAGHTDSFGPGVRRALLRFDISSIPANATIESVSLTLNQSLHPAVATPTPMSLHPVLESWGQGTSDADGAEGMGAPATTGDATWLHRFFDTTLWTTQGGTFTVAASAVTIVDVPNGPYTWGPTDAMKADVQGWIDQPATNFGWILIGDEANLSTARRFDSRENLLETGPALTIVIQGDTGSGRVPDGRQGAGPPLMVSRLGTGELTLTWGASCVAGDTDYIVYEGALGNFTSHAPRACSTGGATQLTLLPASGSAYYLVAPRNLSNQGSLGVSSLGVERPPGTSQCLPVDVSPCP